MLSEHFIAHNCRVKYYPDSVGQLYPYEAFIAAKNCFHDEGWELIVENPNPSRDTSSNPQKLSPSDHARAVSFARAKNRCFDILMSNVFAGKKDSCGLFVTLTFSADIINRYDYAAIIRQLNRWLDNRVRRHGLKYLLVPEFHKDGAIHFHGVMNEAALRLVFSGVKQQGKRVYNIQDFPFGFSNVKRITGKNSTLAVAKYILKYLVKSGGEKVGGRYYLHGGALAQPVFHRLDVDFFHAQSFATKSFKTDYLGECLTISSETSALTDFLTSVDFLGV